MAASKNVQRQSLTALTRAVPAGTVLVVSMRDEGTIPEPAHPYLKRLDDRPVAAAHVKCWHVNQDPDHLGLPSPFDLAVLGSREVYWGALAIEPRPFEQSFLLSAIQRLEVHRPSALGSALPEDAVVVTMHTPSGQTVMVCPTHFAEQLEAAVRASAQRPRKKRR